MFFQRILRQNRKYDASIFGYVAHVFHGRKINNKPIYLRSNVSFLHVKKLTLDSDTSYAHLLLRFLHKFDEIYKKIGEISWNPPFYLRKN